MSRRRAQEKLQKLRHALRLDKAHPMARKVIVGILGGICFVAGVAMLILPGPAIIFVPLGLLLLATEFIWARRWAHQAQVWIAIARRKWRQRRMRAAKSRELRAVTSLRKSRPAS